ncbi:MAG: redoxin domain-containing protein [Campylobacterales bacterium]|nr:redoxin domain-containing protein [Campylobacterales bacterium]
MKFLKEILLFILIFFVLSFVINEFRKSEQTPKVLGDFKYQTLDAGIYDIQEYGGKPTIVQFWATWCRVCKVEISNMDALSKNYNVITVAVSSGNDSDIMLFLKQKDLHFKVINDNEGKLAKKFGVNVYPTTFIYNAKNELKFSETGYISELGVRARVKLIQ